MPGGILFSGSREVKENNGLHEKERGGEAYSGRPITWQGKIALPYPSDYGYAADLGKCTKQLGSYNDTTCTSNNWMKAIVASNYCWLLTPGNSLAYDAWFVLPSGFVGFYDISVYNEYGVAPVLYLGSELSIKAGTGSSTDPYQLSA